MKICIIDILIYYMEKNKAKRIIMSIAKKIRKGKMARKQKERQEKVKNILKRKLNEALEDPANRKIIELAREIMSNEMLFLSTLDIHVVNDEPLYDTK